MISPESAAVRVIFSRHLFAAALVPVMTPVGLAGQAPPYNSWQPVEGQTMDTACLFVRWRKLESRYDANGVHEHHYQVRNDCSAGVTVVVRTNPPRKYAEQIGVRPGATARGWTYTAGITGAFVKSFDGASAFGMHASTQEADFRAGDATTLGREGLDDWSSMLAGGTVSALIDKERHTGTATYADGTVFRTYAETLLDAQERADALRRLLDPRLKTPGRDVELARLNLSASLDRVRAARARLPRAAPSPQPSRSSRPPPSERRAVQAR